MKTFLIVLAALAPLWAQEIKIPESLDRLAEKADESVVVTLDKSILQLTSKFLDKDKDGAGIKNLLAGLDALYVRCYEFSGEGQYSRTDVDAIRAQLTSPPWARIVGVRSKRSGENVDVYFKDAGKRQLSGIIVISAEPKEFTVVNLVGTFDPDRLADLGGEFHIPCLDTSEIRKGRP